MKNSEKLSAILGFGHIEIMTSKEAIEKGLLLDNTLTGTMYYFKGNDKFEFESVIQPAKSFGKFVNLIYSVVS